MVDADVQVRSMGIEFFKYLLSFSKRPQIQKLSRMRCRRSCGEVLDKGVKVYGQLSADAFLPTRSELRAWWLVVLRALFHGAQPCCF